MNILDQIMGVREAADMWGLSPDRVKGLCQSGEVKARKIGNSWVLLKDQPNPKRRDHMRQKETFTVELLKEHWVDIPEQSETVYDEQEAIEIAEKWAETHSDKYVYIRYFRRSDEQHAYLNRDGYDISGKNWTDKE